MQEPRAFWQEVYNHFDPDEPAKHDGWRADRPYSPRKEIVKALQRPIGSTRFLLMGTTGTGKTTELLAIGDALTRTHLVVYVDLWAHFAGSVGDPGALQRLQAWEVVAITGLALVRAAQERFGHDWKEQTLKSFQGALSALLPAQDPRPELNLAKLAGGVATLVGGGLGGGAAAGLTALSTLFEAGAWDVRLGERGQPRASERDPRIHALLDSVNALFGELQSDLKRRAAVLIDGLDRVEEYTIARSLFVDSTLLGSLQATTIIVGPIRHKIMAAQVELFTTKPLANAPVLEASDPRRPAPRGLSFLAEVFRRRVADLAPPHGLQSPDESVPRPELERLAQYSGGRVRDFIRLIRLASLQAYDENIAVITPEIVHACLDERRRVIEMGLTRADLDVLRKVMEDPQHLLPDDEHVDRLLATDRLLPFPNDSEWYYPHPLLTLHMLATPG